MAEIIPSQKVIHARVKRCTCVNMKVACVMVRWWADVKI